MIHERFDVDDWVEAFPLTQMNASTDVPMTLAGPLPVAYREQVISQVRNAGGELGEPAPVDLCIWQFGDSPRRDVTKVGGVPYWPLKEPWPTSENGRPYTFVAQFCFADSRDILPSLPGDLLSILATEDDYSDIECAWFEIGEGDLLDAQSLPTLQWTIQPCHAVLHRTAEYPQAEYDYKLVEQYRGCRSIRWIYNASKIGRIWDLRGELPDPDDIEDEDFRKEVEQWWDQVEQAKNEFIGQLGSIEASRRQPFLNVDQRDDLEKNDLESLLMIADVGGYDIFDDGETTELSWWSG